MEYIKTAIKVVRAWAAIPFLFIGAGFYWVAEKIAGELFTWRGDMAGRQAILDLRRDEAMNPQRYFVNGFRSKSRRKR